MNAFPSLQHAQTVHGQLVAAARDLRGAEHRCATLLRRFVDEKLHHALGYAHIGDYAEEVLDLTPRKMRALLHVARRLPDLPCLDEAFAAGRIGWTKARELVRVVTPETEEAWVARAQALTSRALEGEVAEAQLGERPPTGAPKKPKGPARIRMVFELDAVEAEIVRDALSWLASQTGEEDLDRGGALAAMAQRILHDAEGDAAPSALRHRIVVEHCPRCGASTGERTEVTDAVADTARCCGDAVDLREGPARGHRSSQIPPATRRAVLHRDRRRCVVPGCRCRLWLDVHHLVPRSRGGTHDEANLVTICPIHHKLVHEGVLAVWRDHSGIRVRGPHGERGDPRGSPVQDGAAGDGPLEEPGSPRTRGTGPPGRARAS